MVTRHLVPFCLLFLPRLIGQVWTEQNENPTTLALPAMAYDPVRDRTICVADRENGYNGKLLAVHEWTGDRWIRLVSEIEPTPTGFRPAMAFDPNRGRIVLVSSRGEVWTFDGAAWQKEMAGLSLGTQVLGEPSLVFDEARQRLVLYGSVGGHPFGLPRIFEEIAGSWVLVHSLPITGARIAWDPATSTVLGFGGIATTSPPSFTFATWSWDGTTRNTLSPQLSPVARALHSLVTDPVQNRPVLIGGAGAWGETAGVHEWDGTNWVAAPPLPEGRWGHAAAFHGAGMIVFGGHTTEPTELGRPADTLVRQADATFLKKKVWRGGEFSAFDKIRATTVGIDFEYPPTSPPTLRTSTFDGFVWTKTTASLVTTPVAIAYHEARGDVLLFDSQSRLWSWTGSQWLQLPSLAVPPMRTKGTLAYDVARDRLVLSGGTPGSTDVWEWNGVSWFQRTPTTPLPANIDHQTCWNPATGRTFAFGGQLGSTAFEWDGSTWTAVSTTAPANLIQHHVVADPVLGIIVTGLQQLPVAGFYYLTRAHRFDGSQWHDLGGLDGLRGINGALVFDGNRQRVIQHDCRAFRQLVLTSSPAEAENYGSGCGSGPLGTPRCYPLGLPRSGRNLTIAIDRVAPAAPTLLCASDAPASLSLGSGCSQLIGNWFVLAASGATQGESARVDLAVPAAPSALGAQFFLQALIIRQGGDLAGIADLSQGVRLVLGD